MRFASNWDKWTIEKQRSYQLSMLKKFLVNQVIRFSPHYSRLHKDGKFPVEKLKTLDDLKHLPFTTKLDMVPTEEIPAKPREFILQPNPDTVSSQLTPKRKSELIAGKLIRGQSPKSQILDEYLPVFFTATTGRSAGQVPFVYSSHDVLRLKEAGRRLYDVAGMVKGKDFLLNLFPYAPHLAFWAVYAGSESSGVPGFHSGGGKTLGTDRILNLISTLKPTNITGVPGYVYHILRIASEKGMDLSSIKSIALGAERTTQGHRDKFRSFLSSGGSENVAILSTYGFTEAKMAFIECPEGEQMGYHLFPDMGIFEVVDTESGEPVGEGQPGEIVYTSIDSRGSVVIRFRTGDYAEGGILYKPCPACGRTVPRLTSNLTRLTNQKELNLAKVKGTLVNMNDIDEIIHAFNEIIEWQVEIGKVNNDPLETDCVTFYVSLKKDSDQDRLTRDVEHEFTKRFEFAPNRIVIESTDDILKRLGMETELKEKRIIDIRNQCG